MEWGAPRCFRLSVERILAGGECHLLFSAYRGGCRVLLADVASDGSSSITVLTSLLGSRFSSRCGAFFCAWRRRKFQLALDCLD